MVTINRLDGDINPVWILMFAQKISEDFKANRNVFGRTSPLSLAAPRPWVSHVDKKNVNTEN